MKADMSDIGILFRGGSNAVFWQALGGALRKHPGLAVYEGDALISKHTALQVLVLEAKSGGRELECQHEIDLHPGLAVVAIDPDSADLLVCTRNVGLDVLVRMIVALAREEAQGSAWGRRRLRLLKYAGQAGGGAGDGVMETDADPRDGGEDGGDPVCRWLELSLRLLLDQEAETAEGGGGWGMTLERARAALSPFAGSSPAALAASREALAAELFAATSPESRSQLTRRWRALSSAFSLTPEEQQILLLVLAPAIVEMMSSGMF